MKKEVAFLILCLALLGGLLYKTFQEGRWSHLGDMLSLRGAGSDVAARPIEAHQVARIEIRRAEDIVSFYRQRDGKWKMTDPVSARPDAAKVQAILDILLAKDNPSQLRIPLSKDLAQQEAALGVFGMAKPVMGVVFDGTFGQQTLWIGDKATAEGDVYARWMQEGYIGLVPAPAAAILNLPIQDLRERRLLHEADAAITGVTFQKHGESLQLLADGRALVSDDENASGSLQFEHRADPGAFKEVLEYLENLSCSEFLDADLELLSSDRLLKIRLTRASSAAEENWSLERASTVQGEKIIIEGPPGKGNYVLEAGSFAKILGNWKWLLDRQWLRLQPDACRYLEWTADGITLAFARVESGNWALQKGGTWPVDQKKIEQFVAYLCALEITDFIACREIPAVKGLTLRVGASEAVFATLNVREEGRQWSMHKQGDSFRFLAAGGQWDWTRCSDIPYWRDLTIWDGAAAEITDIGLSQPGAVLEFARDRGAWRLGTPRHGDANQALLDDLLTQLLPLKARRFLGGREASEFADFKPVLRLGLGTADSKRVLLVGRMMRDGFVARMEGEPDVFVLSTGSVTGFLKNPLLLVSLMQEDSNADGRVDQWVYYRDGRRVRLDSDDDADGDVDSKTFWRYDARGDILRVDTDTDNDGAIDQRTYYSRGKPYRQEDDATGDGRANVWTSFVRGAQARQRVDSDRDGRPDVYKNLLRNAAGEITGARVHQKSPEVKDYVEKYEPSLRRP